MKTILGLDPGRDKCGLAVMDQEKIAYHQVINSSEAIAIIQKLWAQYSVDLIVMGNGTTSKNWCREIEDKLLKLLLIKIPIVTVDERNSTVEARDRYWLMYPPTGLKKLIPQGLRIPPRPVDDIVAILLIERYLDSQVGNL